MQVNGWHRISAGLWSMKTFRRQQFQTDGKHRSFRASGSSLRTVGRGNIPNGGSLREDESSSSDPLSIRFRPQSNLCSEQWPRIALIRFRHKNKAYAVWAQKRARRTSDTSLLKRSIKVTWWSVHSMATTKGQRKQALSSAIRAICKNRFRAHCLFLFCHWFSFFFFFV